MRPIHAMVHWDCLMAALDERAANGTVRQDTSRENIFLCQGYAQLKRLEYAFYLGFSLEEEGYAPEIGACYRQEDRFTGEERLIYALALLRGHSIRSSTPTAAPTTSGTCGPRNIIWSICAGTWPLTDNDALRRQLLQTGRPGLSGPGQLPGRGGPVLCCAVDRGHRLSSGLLQPPLAPGDGWGGHRFSGRGICALNHTDTEESQVE